ncbi:MAG: tyrosine-type recombinase/integrase [Rhizobiaceae bacterium]|nr:tyrosine-type recombinase/integrase [Rhizobiaceae bacterium]
MAKRLTAKTVANIKAPPGRPRIDVRDDLLVGLSLRVSESGRKVFYLIKRIDGQNKRIKLGTYPLISLEKAREKARQILISVEDGSYFEAQEKEERQTLGELIPLFIEIYAKRHTRDWTNTERLLAKFAPLFDKPVADVRRADVVKIIDQLIARGMGSGANRVVAAIKKLMNWAVDRGVIDVSPLTAMKLPIKEVARERVLANDELRALWKAADGEGYPFGDILKVLVATGQRRAEVAEMRWSEIDFEAQTWTLPSSRVKNATIHVVPLSPMVVGILRSLPRFLKSDYVFTTTGRSPFSGFGRCKDRIDDAVQFVEPWRLHDLRRTMATKMAELRIAPHIIEAVLNHRSGIVSGVAAIYNRHAYSDEKREALGTWSEEICRISQGDVVRSQIPKQLA